MEVSNLFCYRWDSISYLMMYYLILYDYKFWRYKRSNCDMFSLNPCSRCYPKPSARKDVVLRQKIVQFLFGPSLCSRLYSSKRSFPQFQFLFLAFCCSLNFGSLSMCSYRHSFIKFNLKSNEL
jgi:hypothetical protein